MGTTSENYMADKIRLIGVGACGSNIIKEFDQYGDVYSTLSIDTEMHDDVQEGIRLKEQANDDTPAHEKYEYESRSYEWNDIEDSCKEVQVFVSGASDVSGVVLQVLEHLKKAECDVTIFYIHPELKFATELQKMQNRVTMGVLQEYARSGLIENFVIIDNAIMAQLVGKTTIANYFPRINQTIARFVHMLNFCKKNEPIFGQKNTFLEMTRISTLGFGSLGKDINLFYNLDNEEEYAEFPLEIQYYFLVPEERVNNDENLMSEIMEIVENRETKYTSISYGVYENSGEHEDVSVLVYLRTSKVQTV